VPGSLGRRPGRPRTTVVHVIVYYPRVNEASNLDPRLTEAATDLVHVFHGAARQVPPSPARDLTLGQMRLLYLLHREGPQPMGRVAEVFELSHTASTGFVTRVERHGLIARRHRSDDRRVVECQLTDEGRRFVEELSGIRLDVIRQALSTLEPADLEEFRRLVHHIRARQESLEGRA
jgi:DNA-binding MarR family transcriptional regulator